MSVWDLDRHVVRQLFVVGQVDAAKPAFPEAFCDAVPTDLIDLLISRAFILHRPTLVGFIGREFISPPVGFYLPNGVLILCFVCFLQSSVDVPNLP